MFDFGEWRVFLNVAYVVYSWRCDRTRNGVCSAGCFRYVSRILSTDSLSQDGFWENKDTGPMHVGAL